MKISNIKGGLVLSYAALIINALINIIYTPLLLRYLGTSEYGLYSLSVSTAGYLSVLSFGFVNAYIRYYYKYKVENDEKKIADLNGMYLFVFMIIGVVSFVVGIIIVTNVERFFGESLTFEELAKAKVLIQILVVNISLTFPLSIFGFYLTAIEKFIFMKSISLIQSVLTPCIMIFVLMLGYRSVGLTIVILVVNITLHLAHLYYCCVRCGYKMSFKISNFIMFKEIAVFSTYIFFNILAEQLKYNAGKIILGRYQGTTDVAIFGIGVQIYLIFLLLSSNITSVFKPRVNELVLSNKKNELDELFIRIGRIQSIVLFLVLAGFIFLGRQFIFFWVGEEFYDSYAIALLLIIPLTLSQVQILSTEIQRARNLHKFRSVLLFIVAIANVVASVFLSQKYSGIGCAIAIAITVLIGNVIIMGIYNQRVIGLNISGLFKSISSFIPAMIPSIITGIIIIRFINLESPVIFVLSGIVFTCIYCGSMWILGLNEYEKNLIRKPVLMLLKRH